MSRTLALLLLLAASATAADWPDLEPSVFGREHPDTKAFPKMVAAEQRKRMQEANERESKLFAAIKTKAEWEKYRDERITKLRESLGTFPAVPKNMKVVTTKTIDGDGFVIRNTLYESRPGWWVTANLYLPAKPPANMPGIVIAHAHHGGKSGGELQDMGMTWARAGVAVLVPDQHGYGERRQHDFNSDKDYPKPFKAGRQDYYFRYNSNLQLSAVGDSLMGWMAWDLMRGVDVLLQQPTIDPKRVILMGSVAGGGDPAGVTAALDDRIACVVPFNFGGWQPESGVLENPDRDFGWFGDGYWESTRGLRGGAVGGFAHFVIVGSVAPRKVIYAHEFAWEAKSDPAWPRLQKVFDFYDAKDSLRVAHGAGSVRNSGPGNTHCNHIGAEHRKMIHPALKDWFGIPIPTEYSKPLPSSDLKCWTDDAKKELKPKTLAEVLAGQVKGRQPPGLEQWNMLVGDTEPVKPEVLEGKAEQVVGGKLVRFALTTDPGITVPLLLISPDKAEGKTPAVVMVASGGKAGFLKERGDALTAFLKAGVAVCLVDVRGTGETRPGTSADRGSSRTSLSQQSLILGQPMLGAQLRDLRTVLKWLATREDMDGNLAVWGDSFAKVNPKDTTVAVPLDVDGPTVSEPGGAYLALLALGAERNVNVIYARGGLDPKDPLFGSPYLYLPHDAVVPGVAQMNSLAQVWTKSEYLKYEATVDVHNKATGDKALSPADAAKWVAAKLK